MRPKHKAKVLKHLKEKGFITPWIAVNHYKCMRLASVINRLRNEGHAIKTVMHYKKDYAYGEYILQMNHDTTK